MAYYWYQSDPQLYQMEVAAMKKFFPSFTINQLQDGSGRLYWRGKVQPTGEGGMVWRTELKPCRVHGIAQIVDELIYNLCDNAIKYNRKGGSVTVSTAEENGQPVLRVADTGIGIPAAEQDRVFERFYRVDKSHSRAIGGTGLGLSIVKHAAAYHHARVALESTLGTGTTVTVTFPRPGEA